MSTTSHTIPVAALAGLLFFSSCSATTDGPPVRAATTEPIAASQGAGAVSDLSNPVCKVDAKGVWRFSGTLTSSKEAKATYTITASVVQKAGGTVAESKQFVKELEPGQSVQFKGEEVATIKDSGQLVCVTSVRAK